MTDEELKDVLKILVTLSSTAAMDSAIAATRNFALTSEESKMHRETIALLNKKALEILGVEVPGIE